MQLNLFDKKTNLIEGNTVLWDGKRMSLDEAIKWAKLRVQLAPSFSKYRDALEFLLEAKGKTNA
jgi:hypothetical protein